MHYTIPPESRLPEARQIVVQGGYFVLHAPRQTGKTTLLRTLARALTAEGRFAAVYLTCETAEPAGDDDRAAQEAILAQLVRNARADLPEELQPPPMAPSAGLDLIHEALSAWAQQCPRPLVLFFDEIDALRGESLRSVLRQLGAGFPDRPDRFPWAVALCGLRDVRDYKAASGGDPHRLGTSSPFNIKVESVRLGDFSEDELRALYEQHTAETGQPFTEEALRRAFELSAGQPWLTNALAREVIEKIGVGPPVPLTPAHLDEAKERLILARQTHLDSLVDRLHEPRVHRVVEPLLAGTFDAPDGGAYDDDLAYVRDLGLVAHGPPLRVANPIYREVIVRVLASGIEQQLPLEPRAFVRPDGTLDLRHLLDEFAAFWMEHGDVLATRPTYHEVAPQLVLMAFMQRVVNGGGFIDREYGVGRGRMGRHGRRTRS